MLNINNEGARGTRRVWFLMMFCAFLVVSLLAIASFSPRFDRPSMLAQAEPTATTVPAAATVTKVVTDTAPVRPTPSGPPPADPFTQLTIFGFISAGNLIAKSDRLPLDGDRCEQCTSHDYGVAPGTA